MTLIRSIAERNTLVTENLRLIDFAIRRLCGGSSFACRRVGSREDMYQIGAATLIRAAGNWDESRGVAFSTYAVRAIFRDMMQALNRGGVIAVPQHHGAEGMRASPRCSAASKRARRVASFSALPDEELDISDGSSATRDVDDEEEIRHLLRVLDARSARVIREIVVAGESITDLAAEMGVSYERIRQIQNAALQRLRASMGATL